jgi:hypothetical protein
MRTVPAFLFIASLGMLMSSPLTAQPFSQVIVFRDGNVDAGY